MTTRRITPAQLARLQTLCSQLASACVIAGTREARLAWANSILRLEPGLQIASFSQLSLDRATRLIDAAQGELGHRAPTVAKPRKRLTAASARRAGLDGRNTDTEFAGQPQIVSPEDIETIKSYYERLGWGREQFEAWLGSRRSPLRGRKQIRTTAEANKVRWALKGMLQAAGRWVDFDADRRTAA